MPVFNTTDLLHDLSNDVSSILQTLKKHLAVQPENVLVKQPQPGSWSVIQCLDHLNGYGRYYIPALTAAINKGETNQWFSRGTFKSGWLGNYFTNQMQPKPDGQLKSKMSTPKGHRPHPQLDASKVLTEFESQQEQLLTLLRRAEKLDLRRLRIAISLTRLIKLSAGDTLRFLIAHEQRHLLQALRAAYANSSGTTTAVTLQSLQENFR